MRRASLEMKRLGLFPFLPIVIQDFNVIRKENITYDTLLIKRLNQADAIAKAENFLEIMGLKLEGTTSRRVIRREQQRVAIARPSSMNLISGKIDMTL